MPGIQVTPERLDETAANFDKAHAQILEARQQLHAQVDQTIGDWRSQASTRFNELCAQWLNDEQGLLQALAEITAELRNAAQRYAHADQSTFRI